MRKELRRSPSRPTCAVALLATLCCCCCVHVWAAASDNNAFTIRHEKTKKCIKVKNLELITGECQETKDLWTWVSQHRLFHLDSKKCLGLDIAQTEMLLKMVDCDSNLPLWWRCADASILSALQNKLTLKNGRVTASIESSDTWRRGHSNETICNPPYREIYTRDGNSYGKPCELPFLVNKVWHHDCIPHEMSKNEWCSTTYNFDQDGKWGYCLKPEDGCQNTWQHDADSGNCYQLNTQATLSWKEAYVSCQRQGGDLLSITNQSELSYIQDQGGIAERFWIGLNQLDVFGGWQWSDHSPLNFLSWSPEMQNSSPLDGSDCGAMNADSGHWKSYPCETALPYVCKKQFNNTKSEFPGAQNYAETQCEPSWLPHSGFCYIPVNTAASWKDAHRLCNTRNSSLISIHSLGDVELVITKLHNDMKEKLWVGLMNEDTPALFKWSDGSEVVFTYWDQNEPRVPFNITPNCVAYLGELGRWSVVPCEEELKYVCMKKGKFLTDTGKYIKDCPSHEDWKRHGDFCYKIERKKASFGTRCNLTITSRFEQEFINSLISKQSRVEENFFWTGLQDINSSGEYAWGSEDAKSEMLTFTNWNYFQPEFPGGCVAMSSASHLGKWEVKDCKNFKAYSICKNYIGPPRQLKVPQVSDPCPQGWKNGSGLTCYKFFHKERVLRTRTWEEAERFCEALGGHLPSFSHKLEIKELHTILREVISDDRWVWIGLNKRNPESLGSWQWSDNKPVSTVFMPLEFQEDDYDTRDCAAVKSLRLRRHPFWSLYYHEEHEEDFYLKPFHCGARLEWVCQIPKGSTPKIPEWYKPDEDGIHGPPLIVDNSEFWFVPNKRLSYQEAAVYCANNESELASVTSFTALTGILSRIANLSGEKQSWWLKSIAPSSLYHSLFSVFSKYHKGLRDCWHVSYHNWYRDVTVHCDTKLPFICEKYGASLLETHDPDYRRPQRKCPEGWQIFLNKCYLVAASQHLPFKQANDYCQTFGGLLPSITNQAEQDFIISLLPNMPNGIWIGLQYQALTQENKWMDGSVLQYSNFYPLLYGRLRKVEFDPFNEEVNNQCGVLLNDPQSSYVGTWNFTSCADTQFVVICQMEPHSEAVENQTQQVLNRTVNYLNVSYTVILKNLTWFEALQECLQNNMQLVSITEQYQQAFLATQATPPDDPLWIGLSSKDGGTHYHWSDGKHVSFSHWSEDDEDLVDDCVYLDSSGFWKTAECDTKKPGTLCYLPGNGTEKMKGFESINCPHKVKNTPWIAFRNSCYAFSVTKDRWKGMRSDDIHHLCRKMNPDAALLSIRDAKENNFVVEQLRSFRGLADWLRLGLFYDNDVNVLKWYDETSMSYNNWRRGRPVIKNNQFFAGVNLDGFWDIYNYTSNWGSLQYNLHSVLVCKLETAPQKGKSPFPKTLDYRNDTYWILEKRLNWYEALRECKQRGGDLASIHGQSQQLFLEDIVKNDGFPLWLGLSSHDGTESDFEWSDGSTFDYEIWENGNSPGNCLFLDTKGFWNRMKCTGLMDGAICYSTKKYHSEQPASSTRCPKTASGSSQWIHYKKHCYAFDMKFYNFSVYSAEDAKEICKTLDPSATLLTIKDAEENAFISTHLKENYCITERVWLGMDSKAQSLNWLDGSEVKYNNWAKGNENASGECSVLLSRNGTWSKSDCTRGQSRAVCKVPQGSNHGGGAIIFAVCVVLALLAGLTWVLYKKKRLQWSGSSSVRYERGAYDDEGDSMFTREDD